MLIKSLKTICKQIFFYCHGCTENHGFVLMDYYKLRANPCIRGNNVIPVCRQAVSKCFYAKQKLFTHPIVIGYDNQ